MANEIRLRSNNQFGALSVGITDVDTTLTSPDFVTLPTVDTTNHLILTLDPNETNGPAEIVRVTAHSAASTTLTVERGYEGSVARAHLSGITWLHGPVVSDFTSQGGHILGQTAVTASSATTETTPLVVATLSGVVVPPSRKIEVEFSGMIGANAAGFRYVVEILEGASVIQLINPSTYTLVGGSNNYDVHIHSFRTPAAGTYTYTAQIYRSAGVGGNNLQLIAGATFPAYLTVYDRGPA